MSFLRSLFSSSEPDPPGLADLTSQSAAPAPSPVVAEPPRPLLVDGMPNFPEVLDRAGITAAQRAQVEKAQYLLERLPSGTTPAVNRKIVEATLAAFELQMHDVVDSANAEIEALEVYVESRRITRQQALDEGDARVRELQNQIAEVRAHTEWAVASEDAKVEATLTRIDRVRPVISFFLHSEPAEASAVVETVAADAPPAAEDEPVLVDLYVDMEGAEAEAEDVDVDDEAEDLELELDLDPEDEDEPAPSIEPAPDAEPAPFVPELDLRTLTDEERARPPAEDGQ